VESIVSLALSSKLKMIFENDSKFLTFPIGLSFTIKSLSFMEGASSNMLTPQEELNYKGDFARRMNTIPEDSTTWCPDACNLLWTRLLRILDEVVLAASTLTDQESEDLSDAIDFLTIVDTIDGLKVSRASPAVLKYYEYKQVFENTSRAYSDEKLSVDNSLGPEGDKLRQKWVAYRERELAENRNKAEQEWRDLGFKERVEYYQLQRNSLESKKSLYSLNEYIQAYKKEIGLSELRDVNGVGIGFRVTYFSPIDAFNMEIPWQNLTLTSEEISTLTKNASLELKKLFSFVPENENNDIDSVSLEYKEVAILRPWFKPEFFSFRGWKLPDDALISDGNIPRKGSIPAYVTNMIVARKVKIKRKNPIQIKSSVSIRPASFSIVGNKLKLSTFEKNQTSSSAEFPTPAPKDTIKPRMIALQLPLRQSTSSIENSRFVKTSLFSIKNNSSLPKDLFTQSPMNTPNISQTIRLADSVAYQRVKLLEATKSTPADTNKTTVAVKVESAVDPNAETYDIEGVFVLALVCRRVPKSPDPDKKLGWKLE
jgi:hypothetical protein